MRDHSYYCSESLTQLFTIRTDLWRLISCMPLESFREGILPSFYSADDHFYLWANQKGILPGFCPDFCDLLHFTQALWFRAFRMPSHLLVITPDSEWVWVREWFIVWLTAITFTEIASLFFISLLGLSWQHLPWLCPMLMSETSIFNWLQVLAETIRATKNQLERHLKACPLFAGAWWPSR